MDMTTKIDNERAKAEPLFGVIRWAEKINKNTVMTVLSICQLGIERRVRPNPWGSDFSTLFLIILNLKCNHGFFRIHIALAII